MNAGSIQRYVQGEARDQYKDADEEQSSCRSVDSTIPSPDDQQPSTSSLGTDPQRTATSESTSPVIESPSAGGNVETCVPPPTDPALWPPQVLDADRVEIVRRGLFKIP